MTVLYINGFESGSLEASSHTDAMWVDTRGLDNASVSTTTFRTGTRALRLAPSASVCYLQKTFTGEAELTGRFYVFFSSLPAATNELFSIEVASGSEFHLGFSGTVFRTRTGAGSWGNSSVPVVINNWYRVDFRADGGTFSCQINGVAVTNATGGGTSYTGFRFGTADAADTYTAYYDDFILTDASADYPWGKGEVKALRVSSDGTHNAGTTGNFRKIDGTNNTNLVNSTTDSFEQINDGRVSGGDLILQNTANASQYAEYQFENTADTQIRGLSSVIAFGGPSWTGTNNAIILASYDNFLTSEELISAAVNWTTAPETIITDSFIGITSNGLGSEDSADLRAWTISGTAANFSTGTGDGHIIATAVSTKQSAWIGNLTDGLVSCILQTDKLATGGAIFFDLSCRTQDASNRYFARVTLNTTQTIDVGLFQEIGGVETQIGSTVTTAVTHAAATYIGIKLGFYTMGSSIALRAKVWLNSSAEPASWDIYGTAPTAQWATGAVGVRAFTSATTTNLSYNFSFDDFLVTAPLSTKSIVYPTPAAGNANGQLNEAIEPMAGVYATWWNNDTAKDGGRPSTWNVAAGFHYVGGHFDTVVDVDTTESIRNHLYRADFTTGELDAWDPNCLPAGEGGGRVWDSAVSPDGTKMVFVGAFTSFLGSTRNKIAVIDANTGALQTMFSGWACNNEIRSCSFDSAGNLYLGGSFTNIGPSGGSSRSRTAKVTNPLTTPALDSSWQPQTSKTVEHVRVGTLTGGTDRAFIQLDAVPGTINSQTCQMAAVNTITGTTNIWRQNVTDPTDGSTLNSIDLAINDELQLVVAGMAGGGGTAYVFDYDNTGLATENFWYHCNGDVQGVGFYKGGYAEPLIYLGHHDDSCAAVKNATATPTRAEGMFVIDKDGILQGTAWRNEFVQNGTAGLTLPDGGGFLKVWGIGAYEDSQNPRLLVWGDFTRVRSFGGSPTTNVHRVANFAEGSGGGSGEWAASQLNLLRIRFGFSSDVGPKPELYSALFEYESIGDVETRNHSLDASIEQTMSKTYSVDARITSSKTKNHSLDAVIALGHQSLTYSHLSLIRKRSTKNYAIDAALTTKTKKIFHGVSSFLGAQTVGDCDALIAAAVQKDAIIPRPRVTMYLSNNKNIQVSISSNTETFNPAGGNKLSGVADGYYTPAMKFARIDSAETDNFWRLFPETEDENWQVPWISTTYCDVNGTFSTAINITLQYARGINTNKIVIISDPYGRNSSGLLNNFDVRLKRNGSWSTILSSLNQQNLSLDNNHETAIYLDTDDVWSPFKPEDLSNLQEIEGVEIVIHNITIDAAASAIEKQRPLILNEIDCMIEYDVSDDVVSVGLRKDRELTAQTLSPIGASAANSFTVTLDNTENKYNNLHVDSPFKGLLNPNVEFKVEFGFDVSNI